VKKRKNYCWKFSSANFPWNRFLGSFNFCKFGLRDFGVDYEIRLGYSQLRLRVPYRKFLFEYSLSPPPLLPVAKFLVPDWGSMAVGCHTGTPAYVAWRAGTTIICQSQLLSPSQGLWIWLLDFGVNYEITSESTMRLARFIVPERAI
jgi:hypothetical protein